VVYQINLLVENNFVTSKITFDLQSYKYLSYGLGKQFLNKLKP